MTPEAQLVLRAHGVAPPDAVVRRILEGPVDWRRVLALVDRERAALPVWRTVCGAGVVVDNPELMALKRLADVWEFKLAVLDRRVAETLGALNGAGIDAILLKGAAAVAMVHGAFGARPMNDVDLLVEPDRAEEAWSLAQELGWRWESDKYPRRAYREAHHLPPLFDSRGSGAGLEIHRSLWMPDHPFVFAEAELRAQAIPARIGEMACRIPSVHHQLLHGAIHFAWSHRLRSHAWRAFSDVRGIVGTEEVEWPALIRLARRTRADTCAYWTLRLCASSLDVTIPSTSLEALAPPMPPAILDRMERHFLMNLMPDEGACPSLALERTLWRVAVRRGPASAGIELPADHAPVGLSTRLARHARSAGEWARYLGRLA